MSLEKIAEEAQKLEINTGTYLIKYLEIKRKIIQEQPNKTQQEYQQTAITRTNNYYKANNR